METIKKIKVLAGQNLWDIAQQEYKTAEGISLLLQANPGINITDSLDAGQELLVISETTVSKLKTILETEPYGNFLQNLLLFWASLVNPQSNPNGGTTTELTPGFGVDIDNLMVSLNLDELHLSPTIAQTDLVVFINTEATGNLRYRKISLSEILALVQSNSPENLSQLGDVLLDQATDKDLLMFNGTKWENNRVFGIAALEEVTAGQPLLYYNLQTGKLEWLTLGDNLSITAGVINADFKRFYGSWLCESTDDGTASSPGYFTIDNPNLSNTEYLSISNYSQQGNTDNLIRNPSYILMSSKSGQLAYFRVLAIDAQPDCVNFRVHKVGGDLSTISEDQAYFFSMHGSFFFGYDTDLNLFKRILYRSQTGQVTSGGLEESTALTFIYNLDDYENFTPTSGKFLLDSDDSAPTVELIKIHKNELTYGQNIGKLLTELKGGFIKFAETNGVNYFVYQVNEIIVNGDVFELSVTYANSNVPAETPATQKTYFVNLVFYNSTRDQVMRGNYTVIGNGVDETFSIYPEPTGFFYTVPVVAVYDHPTYQLLLTGYRIRSIANGFSISFDSPPPLNKRYIVNYLY